MVMPRCQLAGYSEASIFLYVYPFALDYNLFVGNNFSRRSAYTCISLNISMGVFSLPVSSLSMYLGGCPFLLPPFLSSSSLGEGRWREGRGREPAPTTGPSSIARGSTDGTFLVCDWFTEGISMVFMLCT